MANIQRHPDERVALQARARALREQGMTLAQVSDEIGVSETTLNRWARCGGWRLSDMAGTAPGADGTEPEIPDDIPDLPPEEAGSVLIARASRYALAGQMARAAVAARLAQQLIELSLRQAEVEVLRAKADRSSQRRLPPELVGVPLDENCRPLAFPEGWDMARANRDNRMDLVPLEILRDDLRQRLVLRGYLKPRAHEPGHGPEIGQDADATAACAEPEATEAAPARMTDNDRMTALAPEPVIPDSPASTGPRIRTLW